MISDTSQTAYDTIKKQLASRQKDVFAAIGLLGRASNQQLADFLHWPINCICPRVFELREQGKVRFAGYGKNAYGNQVHLWQQVEKLLFD